MKTVIKAVLILACATIISVTIYTCVVGIPPPYNLPRMVVDKNGNLVTQQHGIAAIDNDAEQSILISNWSDIDKVKKAMPEIPIPDVPEDYKFLSLYINLKRGIYDVTYTYRDLNNLTFEINYNVAKSSR